MIEIVSVDGYPPIQLAWRQKVAAYWSIFWGPAIASFFLAIVLPFNSIEDHATVISWVAQLIFFLVQGMIVRRLITKKYSTFRIGLLREGKLVDPTLSAREAVQLAMRVALPQILFLLLIFAAASLLGKSADQSISKILPTISLWGRILAVGPYAVQHGINVKYRTFRLQAFGQRYI